MFSWMTFPDRLHKLSNLRNALLFTVFLIFYSATSWASITVALDLEDLALASDEVVVAEVVAEQTEPSGGMILTRYTLRASQSIAGNIRPSEELEVVAAGGEYNGIGALVHGSPRLRRGQIYLLFLRRGNSHYSIVGLAQGALRVTTDEVGEQLVHPAEGIPSLVRMAEDSQRPASPALTTVMDLSEIVARIVEVRHGL